MKRAQQATKKTSRVARRRKKIAARGARRVEVTVPSHDAPLVKAMAGVLRLGGEDANRIRKSLQFLLSAPKAKTGKETGKELMAFLRASPLVETELQIERDRTTGRCADLG